MSSSGMRVRTEGKPHLKKGDIEQFSIASQNQQLNLQATVMWVRRAGLFSKVWEVGVRFVDQREGIRAAIDEFARMGFVERDGRSTQATSAKPQSTIKASMAVEDLYAVLGVERDATGDGIRTAFRKLALKYHPDRCKDEDAAERFARIDKAYSVLRDPKIRARYDAMLDQSKAA